MKSRLKLSNLLSTADSAKMAKVDEDRRAVEGRAESKSTTRCIEDLVLEKLRGKWVSNLHVAHGGENSKFRAFASACVEPRCPRRSSDGENSQLVDAFIHVANVIYVVSYLVRDILWLRCLTVLAGTILMPYFYFNNLWPPIIWGFVFMAVNAWQIRALLIERRPVVLNDKEQHLYQTAFRALKPREFLELMKIGSWKEAPAKETLVEAGKVLDRMMVVYEGKLDVDVGGRHVASLDAGCFVGEIAFLTGEKPNAEVVASENTSYVSWPMESLRKFLDTNPDARASWQFLIGSDLAAKLKNA